MVFDTLLSNQQSTPLTGVYNMTINAYAVIGESTTLSHLGEVILFDHWIEGVYFDLERAARRAGMLTYVVEISTIHAGYVDFKQVVEYDSGAKSRDVINWFPSVVSYSVHPVEIRD